MDRLKVVSLNVRGINNALKRRKVFRFLKRQKGDVYFLQETYGSKGIKFMWESEWGNKCIFAHRTTSSSGVAILLTKKTASKVSDISRDVEGRRLHCKLTVNEYTYALPNIYAPNRDEEGFFEEVFREVNRMECVFNVTGGDFNVIRDPMKDRNNGVVYHKKCKAVIDAHIESQNEVDVWRMQHPDKKYFTYMRGPATWSRIDYFLLSQSLVSNCEQSSIIPSVCTDHSCISIVLKTCEGKRGPGTWKFNNELLNDQNFQTELEKVVLGCKRSFHYLRGTEFWDLLKFEMKQFSRDFAKAKNQVEKYEKFVLYEKLECMQTEYLMDEIKDKELESDINSVKTELKAFETVDAQRSAFRCKKSWLMYGEKCSKYFFNLEKRNYLSKTMYIVKKRDGSLTKDYTEILNEQFVFYKDLYTRDEKVTFDLKNKTGTRLTAAMKEKLDNMISKDELFDAVMTLKPNKVPGLDGLTVEFYKAFWSILRDPLYECYQDSVASGCFNSTARRGVINLIPKGASKDELLLRNWRPISLLNVDLKIWSKAIANRLEETVELIGKQQNGFIKGRSIFTNITTTREVISYLNRNWKESGVIITFDFEKCFDRVSHESIKKVFEYFNFGERFISMLTLMFTNWRCARLTMVTRLISLRKPEG